MKKILALIDGEHFPQGALAFAQQLNEAGNILLTGLFLPSIDYTDILLYYGGGLSGPVYIPTLQTDPETITRNVERFSEYCVRNGIEYRVHTEIDDNIKNAIHTESMFSDLMLIEGKTFYSNLGTASQQDYMKGALHRAECPVVIIPEHFKPVQNLVVAYDGSEESVYAIKQFSYVLPELCNLPVTVVYAGEDIESMPALPYMEELCGRHFKDLTFFKLDINPRKYFNTWMMDRGNSIVAAGSYSTRGLFRKHFVDELIKDHKLPVFIAHK
jgi:hypothetical protein